jgi:predicted deacylase
MAETTNKRELTWNDRQWQIGNLNEIHANSKQAGYIEHGSYADGTPLQTPVHVIAGADSGPILYVQAAVHGDEVNGVEVIRRLVTGIEPGQLQGMLIAVPVTNGLGLIQRQRRNPIDEEDMNRIWPGKRGGSTSQQIAYQIYNQAIRQANYVIDLHTANSNTLLHVVYARNDAASHRMAEIFGLEILLAEDISDEELQQARFTGKLRNYLNVQGIAAITPELGGNNYFEEDHIALGLRGVTNVMKHLGMVQGEVQPPDHPQITLYGSHLDKVRANQGGIWVTQVKPGERVTNGQPIGYVYSMRTFEIIERHFAPYDGYVTGTADMPMVNIGDSLVSICRQ